MFKPFGQRAYYDIESLRIGAGEENTMEFIRWIIDNFGVFFGGVFLLYIYLMIRRLTLLYDVLREIPSGEDYLFKPKKNDAALQFLDHLLKRLAKATASGTGSRDPVVDAIWSELECRTTVHFTALNGYVNTLILVGFAGTIFGSIGAFNEMFKGLAQGEAAAVVFVGSWNNGLATALYTSLGAAAIGGSMITVLCSRFLMTRAKRLETIVGLKISQIIEEEEAWHEEDKKTASVLNGPRILEKISMPTSTS